MHTVPFHLFKSSLADHLVSLGLYDQEWFASQTGRICRWHNADETLDGAKDMIETFARGRREAALAERMAQPVKAFALPNARRIATRWVRV
jgi:hypothetical protein